MSIKKCVGGLGFRNLICFNLALLAMIRWLDFCMINTFLIVIFGLHVLVMDPLRDGKVFFKGIVFLRRGYVREWVMMCVFEFWKIVGFPKPYGFKV